MENDGNNGFAKRPAVKNECRWIVAVRGHRTNPLGGGWAGTNIFLTADCYGNNVSKINAKLNQTDKRMNESFQGDV